MRRNRSLSNHHIHFLQQISRMEYGAQNEERLLTGREMIRAICYRCSVRSELGQHRISRDIFQIIIDPNCPDADYIISIMNGHTFINSSTASDLHVMRCELRSTHTSSSNAGSLRSYISFANSTTCQGIS
eukprot:269544-Pyramimonas_sp.AAC.1